MSTSDSLRSWRFLSGQLRGAVASAVTYLADLEADRDLRRRSGIDVRRRASGQYFTAAKNRVLPVDIRAPKGEIPAILKRPPVRISQKRSRPGLLTEARVLQSLSGGGNCAGVMLPTVLGVGRGRHLGGSVIVMDKLPGKTISRPEWYRQEALDVLADAYYRVHSALAPAAPQLDWHHPVMEHAARLFNFLPASVRADVQAIGGMPTGLVHGDPHPGNWLWVEPACSVNLVDWGDSHVGWPIVEIARCGLFISERVGEEAGIYLLERYLHRGPKLSDSVIAAGHMIAERWPRGDDEALAKFTQVAASGLRARREAYLRIVLGGVQF